MPDTARRIAKLLRCRLLDKAPGFAALRYVANQPSAFHRVFSRVTRADVPLQHLRAVAHSFTTSIAALARHRYRSLSASATPSCQDTHRSLPVARKYSARQSAAATSSLTSILHAILASATRDWRGSTVLLNYPVSSRTPVTGKLGSGSTPDL